MKISDEKSIKLLTVLLAWAIGLRATSFIVKFSDIRFLKQCLPIVCIAAIIHILWVLFSRRGNNEN